MSRTVKTSKTTIIPNLNLYYYKFEPVRVVDGDTIIANIDLGFNIIKTTKIRFARINAYELNTPKGKEAKEYITQRLQEAKEKILYSTSLDKYGRSLAEIYLDGQNLNTDLINKNFAYKF